MSEYNLAPFSTLAEQLRRLPGIGSKSAARLAYFILEMPEKDAEKFTSAITNARKLIHRCKICGNYTDKDVCSICSDNGRDKSLICVVEDTQSLLAIEKISSIKMMYHILNGVISPINGITPDMLRIKELLARLGDGKVKEIILATNATIEGEATAMYISKLVKPLGVKVTRLACGIPVGGDLEYADEITLSYSIEGRHEI